jgi:hypothetical protein
MQPPYHRQIGAREKFRLVLGLPASSAAVNAGSFGTKSAL